MLRFLSTVLAVVCVVFTSVASAADQVVYLKDGKLTQKLVFKDTQGGFAGFTGNTYVVMGNGNWTVTRVFNQRKFPPHAKGTLNAKQLKALADLLEKNKISELPKTIGSRAQANPKVVTLTFGKTTCTCALPAGLSNPKRLPKGKLGDVGRRLLAVNAFLKANLKAKTK